MANLKPGYILHADPDWVSFHLANSMGGAVGYCRGPGAPFKNVQHGGKVFFRDRTVSPKEIVFWAEFDSAALVTVDEGWGRFGRELGAGSLEEWHALVGRLPAIAQSKSLIVVRCINATAFDSPVQLSEADVVDVRGATKGWSIGAEEVARLLGNTAIAPVATDIELPATVRVSQSVSRIIRDTAIVRRLKRLHNHECQICGQTIALVNGSRYSEGHHLQPLGGNHSGPDIAENIICLCPNHHAAFDLGAIELVPSMLRIAAGHTVGRQYIDYHNQKIYRG